MKKYIILFIIQLFLIILILLLIIFNKFLISSKTNVIFSSDIKLEIYSVAYNIDYILKLDNCELITERKELYTGELGIKKEDILVKNRFGKIKEYNFNYEVVDTIKPIITFMKKITTEEGTKVDLLKDVSVTDNSKENIIIKVEGKYNFNKSGTYNLFYVAEDSSGNITKEEFQLIIEKKKEVMPIIPSDNSFTTKKGYKGYTKNGLTYINGLLIVNKTYSLPSNYNPGLNGNVKKQAQLMFDAAKENGFNLYIGSGFRSYKTQKNLYNNYVKKDGVNLADTYSARPGHSEHQTGLAIDVCNPGYPCITSRFDNTPPANWLNDNAYKYGFIIRYPKGKTNETGYKYESWHLRYVGIDLAKKLYNNGNWITLESYFGIDSSYKK